ncbi:MAG: hypothetical protein J2P36_02890 [Ktedonobacteraceae bacterium]|nr:hypothetical protein [Ktedonobacteraceae bacterium]
MDEGILLLESEIPSPFTVAVDPNMKLKTTARIASLMHASSVKDIMLQFPSFRAHIWFVCLVARVA